MHILYLLFIAPLEFLYRLVLEWGILATHSWGMTLVLLSLAVNTVILPIYNWAECKQEEERELRRRMSRHEDMLRRTFTGQKRFFLLSALRRQFGYGYGFILRASVGLLLQIPFFIAAYHLLSNWKWFNGQSFGPLSDLGAPDALLSFGGFTLNLLPFLMTVVNLASAFVYTSGLTRRDKVQIYVLALLFLALLYTAPSALTLYWTLNNIYSLGKNIVEKDWMRRPAWQAFWSAIRGGMSLKEGTLNRLVSRFLQTSLYSFGTASIFWLYTCATELEQRRYLLDRDFRNAISDLALQYGVSSFLLSLIMVVAVNIHSHKRLLLHPVLIIASICTFFAVPWTAIPKFILFVISLYYFKQYQYIILNIIRKTTLYLLYDYANTDNSNNDEIKNYCSCDNTKQELLGSSLIIGCIFGAACSIFIWVFIPFYTYFSNANEFNFNGFELFKMIIPYCIIFTVVISLILYFGNYIIPCEYVKFVFKKKIIIHGRVNILYSIIFSILLCLLLEGTILSYGLPQLDGETDLFNSKIRSFIDALIVFFIIFLGIWKWRILIRNLGTFLLIFYLVTLTSLFDAFRNRAEKIDVREFLVSDELIMVEKVTFFSNLSFGKSSNIIILLVDSLDTLAFEKTLVVYPELANILEGFWLFRENLGTGGYTHNAIPQILRGKIFDNSESEFNFVRESLIGVDSMGGDAVSNNYDVFIDAAFSHYVTNRKNIIVDNANILPLNNIFIQNIQNLFFKFYPYYCKHLFERTVNINNYDNDFNNEQGDIDINKKNFSRYLSRIDNITERKSFHFIYFFGAHKPFVKENIIDTTKEFLLDFNNFITTLKKKRIYDNSTIVMISDHGLYGPDDDHRIYFPERLGKYSTGWFPLLMIKPEFSSDEFKIREDLMSSAYLRYILKDFYKYGATNETLEAYLINLPATRYILYEGIMSEAQGRFNSLSIKKLNTNKNR